MKIFRYRDVIPQLPNIFFRRRLKFIFEKIPYEAKGLTLKKISNFFIAGLNQFILPSKPFGYPVILQVEPANFCNITCPLCLTTSQTASRPKSLLSFNTFKNLIDEIGDYLLLIILWNWGEPFLNPDIYRMISYAKLKGILVFSSTNGNLDLNNKKAEELIDSGLDSLVFGVDGATQETYSKYRKVGNFQKVLTNIKTIVDVKRRKKSMTPLLNLRFVVMKHNEKEVPAMQKLAESLEVDYFTLKTVDLPSALGDNLDNIYVPEERIYQRYEYKTGSYIRIKRPFTCMRPWKRITMDALGEIIPCEMDYKDIYSFGKLNNRNSALSIWKGEKAKVFRKEFNRGNNESCMCKDCTYKNRVADDCTIRKTQLSQKKQ